jgi:hypothetical protein
LGADFERAGPERADFEPGLGGDFERAEPEPADFEPVLGADSPELRAAMRAV